MAGYPTNSGRIIESVGKKVKKKKATTKPKKKTKPKRGKK